MYENIFVVLILILCDFFHIFSQVFRFVKVRIYEENKRISKKYLELRPSTYLLKHV